MIRRAVSRWLDVGIWIVTLAYGVLFLLFEVIGADGDRAFAQMDVACTIVLLALFLASSPWPGIERSGSRATGST